MEFAYDLKIPKERIAVLIGTKGEIKKQIEEETNSKIKIDSKEGEVGITGEDSLGLFTAREIIKAIARGFNPETALLILKADYTFEMINLPDHIGKSKSDMVRLKGRVIGKEGKTRRLIESTTDTYISIYGKTIGIIGENEKVNIAKRAIEKLLKGSTHSSVYRWLEKMKKTAAYDQEIELKEEFVEKNRDDE